MTSLNNDVEVNLHASQMHALDEKEEIDIGELFSVLLEKWKSIVLWTLLATVLVGVVSVFLITPQYEATSKLYVMGSKNSAVNLSDLQIGSYLTDDYKEVFKTWEVHERVIENLNLNYDYTTLNKMIQINNPSNTRILEITIKSSDPDEATSMANEYAKVAQKYISETMRTEEPNVLSVALRPLRPSSPRIFRNVLLGFILGFLISCVVICIRFIADDRIKTADDISRYIGIPTLAIVPRQKKVAIAAQLNPAQKEKRRNKE